MSSAKAIHREIAPQASQRSIVKDITNRTAAAAYTIWLFTRSDLKTILVPTSIFGITNSLALSSYGLSPDANGGGLAPHRLPLVLFWIWIHLLSFNVNNQRSPASVAEDKLNKPWRPLAAGRISPPVARMLGIIVCPTTTAVSLAMGVAWRQSLLGVLLTVWYNKWGGSEVDPLLRNFITGLGYVCFTSGALEVAAGLPLPLFEGRLAAWLAILLAVVTTTMHVQDLEDVEGDRQRDRRTAPIVLGDAACRWSIALPMLGWGILCPWFWNVGPFVAAASCFLAFTVAWRTLFMRDEAADRVTFWAWNAWMSSLYVLPFFQQRA